MPVTIRDLIKQAVPDAVEDLGDRRDAQVRVVDPAVEKKVVGDGRRPSWITSRLVRRPRPRSTWGRSGETDPLPDLEYT